MKKLLVLLLSGFVLCAQSTNKIVRPSPTNPSRQLALEFRQKVDQLSPADRRAIQRILDKYPSHTNAPPKTPKAK